MSPSLPIVSGRDVVRALAKAGFSEVSQRGSHLKLRNEAGRTLRSILRQADLSVEAFIELL